MHPVGQQGRRRARAEAITRTYQNRKSTVYVDAATYVNGRDAVVTMIDSRLKEKVSASLENCTLSDSEEAAVALAVAEGNRSGRSLVITDSQDACRRFINCRVGRKAAGILKAGGESKEKHEIIWAPGHEGIAGNLQADIIVLGYASGARSEAKETEAVTRTYGNILEHFRGTKK